MGELVVLKGYNPGTFEEVLKKIVETSIVSPNDSVDIRTKDPIMYQSKSLPIA
jgi:hypothetical protein